MHQEVVDASEYQNAQFEFEKDTNSCFIIKTPKIEIKVDAVTNICLNNRDVFKSQEEQHR